MLLSVLYIIGITAEGITGALAAGREKMAPTIFLVSPRSTAVLPPMEESIMERVVVGQLMKSMPRM